MEAAQEAVRTLFTTGPDGRMLLDPRREPRTFEMVQNYLQDQLRNAEKADRVITLGKSIATFKYLGLNPKSALVNLTTLATQVWGKGDARSFMHLLAAPLAMGGVSTGLGAVGWTAAKAIHSTLGDSRDPKEAFFSWVRRALGQDAEQYARFGAFGALGIDVSGSMDTQIRMSASLKDLAGPIGGVANDLVGDRGAAHYLATGQPGKALEKALPTGVANPFQAMRENTEGVTSSRGYPWRDDQGGNYMPTQAETAAKAMGFR